MGRSKYRWVLDRKSYLFGVGSALAVVVVFSAMALYYVAAYGVTVHLDSEALARTIELEVVSQAKQELPKIITDAKAEIPHIVETEMHDQFSERMEIAGFIFSMPEELMTQLREKMRTNVENATGQILDGINTQILAEQFGDNVYTMVKQTMSGELSAKGFPVYIFDKIPVVVRVQVK
ncbi:MAG TPA: hypothetical protein VFC74_00580 [Oscillospiraceae bacterium]|nr:hypothetical protein [Oscillospiraceae bacterium]